MRGHNFLQVGVDRGGRLLCRRIAFGGVVDLGTGAQRILRGWVNQCQRGKVGGKQQLGVFWYEVIAASHHVVHKQAACKVRIQDHDWDGVDGGNQRFRDTLVAAVQMPVAGELAGS